MGCITCYENPHQRFSYAGQRLLFVTDCSHYCSKHQFYLDQPLELWRDKRPDLSMMGIVSGLGAGGEYDYTDADLAAECAAQDMEKGFTALKFDPAGMGTWGGFHAAVLKQPLQ